LAYRFTNIYLKNETMLLHVLASPGHPQGNSLYISEGIQAFTLLAVFQLYYHKMFTEMNNFFYTGIVNILSC